MTAPSGRLPAKPETRHDRPRRWLELGLGPAAALFWMVSLLRVVGAVLRRETFGAEATLALLVVLGIPWLALGGKLGKRA